MKYYLVVAALCTFLVIEVIAAKHPRSTRPPRPPKPQKCYNSEDCEADECCVGDPKKFFKRAECRKLEVEGNRCSEEDAHFKGRYLLRCPCVEGLTCESRKAPGRKDGKLKFNARCVGNGTSPDPELETEDPTEASLSESSESESNESKSKESTDLFLA